MTTQVRDFLLSAAIGESGKTSLEGVFVMSRGRAYLASSMEAKEDLAQAVSLDYDKLKPLLLLKVPAYGGGAYLYCDSAIVEGVVIEAPKGDCPRFVFRDIVGFALTRRSETFQIVS